MILQTLSFIKNNEWNDIHLTLDFEGENEGVKFDSFVFVSWIRTARSVPKEIQVGTRRIWVIDHKISSSAYYYLP